MTSLKNIKFGSTNKFPIKPGDIVTVKAQGDIMTVKGTVDSVYIFTLFFADPITFSDGVPLKKITIVDHGFEVTHVNDKPLKSYKASNNKDTL